MSLSPVMPVTPQDLFNIIIIISCWYYTEGIWTNTGTAARQRTQLNVAGGYKSRCCRLLHQSFFTRMIMEIRQRHTLIEEDKF